MFSFPVWIAAAWIFSIAVGAPKAKPPKLTLTEAAPLTFPLNYVTQHQQVHIDINRIRKNRITDRKVSYSCLYQKGYGSALPCTKLPGRNGFNSDTGVFHWIADDTAFGPYQVSVSGTLPNKQTDTETFWINVRQPYSLNSLQADFDAQFSRVYAPALPQDAHWTDLTPNAYTLLLSGFANNAWRGGGAATDPYRLFFNEDSAIDFDLPLPDPLALIQMWMSLSQDSYEGTLLEDPSAGVLIAVTPERALELTSQERVTPLASMPLGYWRLDGANPNLVIDQSGNHLNLLIDGNLPIVDGPHDGVPRAAAFDATAHAKLRSIAFTPFDSAWSVEAWIRATPGTTYRTIANWYEGGSYYSFYLEPSGHLSFYMRDHFAQSAWVRSHNPVDEGLWHHVAAVYDTERLSMYLDGVLIDGVAAPLGPLMSPDPSVANDFVIGAVWYGSSAGAFFKGEIAEVVVYRRALTQVEITNHMSPPRCITQALTPNNWYLLSVLTQPDHTELYLNGEWQCTVRTRDRLSAQHMRLGASHSGGGGWRGFLADIKFYSSASDALIRANYDAMKPRFAPRY